MAWVKLHDGAMGNLKIVSLSDSAFRLWVKGLCYCQTNLTDGLIPGPALKDLGAKKRDIEILSTPQVEGRAPLWEPHLIGGFKVHDYLLWNDCRETVLKRQQDYNERKKKWQEKRKAERAADAAGTRSERVTNVIAAITQPNQTKPVRTKDSPPTPSRIVALDPRESIRWFDRLYRIYPNKDRKIEANDAWIELAPDADLAAVIHADVQGRVTAGWAKYERRFIPQLRNYLKNHMWEDLKTEVETPWEEDQKQRHAWTCQACGDVHEGTRAQAGSCLRTVAAK